MFDVPIEQQEDEKTWVNQFVQMLEVTQIEHKGLEL